MSLAKMSLTKMSLSHFDIPFSCDIHKMTSVIDIDTTNAFCPSSVIRHKKIFALRELMYLFICVSVIRHSSIAQTEPIPLFFFSFYPSSVIRHLFLAEGGETAQSMTKIRHPSFVIQFSNKKSTCFVSVICYSSLLFSSR